MEEDAQCNVFFQGSIVMLSNGVEGRRVSTLEGLYMRKFQPGLSSTRVEFWKHHLFPLRLHL